MGPYLLRPFLASWIPHLQVLMKFNKETKNPGRKKVGLGLQCHGHSKHLRQEDPEAQLGRCLLRPFLASWIPYLLVLMKFNKETKKAGRKTGALGKQSSASANHLRQDDAGTQLGHFPLRRLLPPAFLIGPGTRRPD
jgi:hypothetical protein